MSRCTGCNGCLLPHERERCQPCLQAENDEREARLFGVGCLAVVAVLVLWFLL